MENVIKRKKLAAKSLIVVSTISMILFWIFMTFNIGSDKLIMTIFLSVHLVIYTYGHFVTSFIYNRRFTRLDSMPTTAILLTLLSLIIVIVFNVNGWSYFFLFFMVFIPWNIHLIIWARLNRRIEYIVKTSHSVKVQHTVD
jgi:hypothetical protein